MADNIMGGGDEINLGLNVNLGLDQSIQDASTLANQIKDMREDQEAFISAISTTQDKMAELSEEYQKQVDLRQQLLDAENQLKGISEAVRQNTKDTVDYYRELSTVVSNLSALNALGGGMNAPDIGGGGSTTGMGNPTDSAGPVLFGSEGRDLRRPPTEFNPGEIPDFNKKDHQYNPGKPTGTVPSNAPVSAPPGTTPVNTPTGPVLYGPNGQVISTPSPSAPTGTPPNVSAPGAQPSSAVTAPDPSGAGDASGIGAIGDYLPSYGRQALIGRNLSWISRLFPDSKTLNGVAGSLGRFANLLGGGDATPFSGQDPFAKENVNDTGIGAGRAGLYYQLGKIALQATQSAFQQGQLFTGLTGGTGVMGALGQDFGAQLTAGFGLNPLENYAEAKQIRMNAAAQGYGLNTNLFNAAVGFGNYAQEKYNINPEESAAMFQQVVVQAGASAAQLRDALDTLANTASTTNASFLGMQQTFLQGQAAASAIGFTGSASTAVGVGLAQQMANPALNGLESMQQGVMGSQLGQALIANQLGVGIQGLEAYNAGFGGTGNAAGNAANSLAANNRVVSAFLARFGITKQLLDSNPSGFARQVLNSVYALQTVLPTLGMDPSKLPTSPETWITWAQTQVGGVSTAGAGTTGGSITATPGLAKQLSGGATNDMSAAMQNMSASSIMSDMSTMQNKQHWSNIGFDVNGSFISQNAFANMSPAQQKLFTAGIMSGSITMAEGNGKGGIAAGGLGGTNTFLDMLTGKSTAQNDLLGQNAFGANSTYAKALQVELGPQATKFFQVISNPAMLQQMLTQWNSSTGGKGRTQ